MKANGTWFLPLLLAGVLLGPAPVLAQPFVDGEEDKSDSESDGREWFDVDALNVGLDAPPEDLKRRTPRDTIRSFQRFAEAGAFSSAAHVLNLSDLDPAEQQEQGSRLAMQLAEILKRGEWINVSNLSGRQDAATEDASRQDGPGGSPRRDIELASLVVGGETHDIRLRRYRVDDEDPVWLITPDSVSSIPLLFQEYGPSLLEKHIPERFKVSLGPLSLWEWIAIPLFLLATGLTGWAVYALVGLLAHWFPSGVPSIFTGMVRVPMALIAMAFVAHALLDYVVAFTAVANTFIRILLVVLIAWGVGPIALRVVDTILLKVTRRIQGEIDDTNSKDERNLLTTLDAIRRLIILVTVVAAFIFVLSQITLFETLGLTLLASASVLTVLVGIAGQAVLGNILSSMQVSLAKPIRIGDLVMFEGQWCHVEGIYYTFIRLRVWDKRRLIVPMTYFVTRPFENLSVESAKMFRTLELSLDFSADVASIREKFMRFAKEEDDVVEHHELSCLVTAQDKTTQTISCYLVASDPFAGWYAEMSIRERLMAFIQDEHPEWWPRDVVELTRHAGAQGAGRGRA